MAGAFCWSPSLDLSLPSSSEAGDAVCARELRILPSLRIVLNPL